MWLILTNRMKAERKGHFLTRHLRMCVYVCSRVHLPFCTFSFCLQCAGYVVTLKPSVNDTRAIFLCYSLGEKEIPEPPLRGVNQPKTTDLESKWVRKFHCIKTLRVVFFFFFFWRHCVACGIFISQPGIEPEPPAVEEESLNHWTSREVLHCFFF